MGGSIVENGANWQPLIVGTHYPNLDAVGALRVMLTMVGDIYVSIAISIMSSKMCQRAVLGQGDRFGQR